MTLITEMTNTELIAEIELLRKENKILKESQSQSDVDNLSMLQNAVETSGEIIFMTNVDGLITYINPEFTRAYGFTAEEIVGKATPRVLKSGLMDQSQYDFFWNTLLTKQIMKGQLINRTKDGRYITVEGSANSIVNSKNEIIGFIAVQRDITNKKNIEEELRTNQQMLSLVLDSFPGEVFWKDRDSKFLGCNNSFAKAAGLSNSQEIIGKNDYEMSWASSAENYIADDKFVMESRMKKFGIIETQLQADGQTKWMETNKVPLVDLQGNVIGILGTASDITERIIAREALKKSESQLRVITDNMYDLVARLDNNGCYVDVTPSYYRALGYTSEDLVGKPCFDFVHPDDAELVKTRFIRGMKKGLTQEVEQRTRNKYGDYIWMHTIGRLIKNENGEIEGVVISSRDITARKKAEEELAGYQAELENMIGKRTEELKSTVSRLKNEILEREQIELDLIKSREEFKTLADNLPDIIIRYDKELKPVYENIKTELTNFLYTEDPELFSDIENKNNSQLSILLSRTFKTGQIQKSEFNYGTNGASRFYEIQTVPELSADKEVESVLAVIRDLTERKTIEQQVQLALEAKEVLLREIHHRVKNNLQSIIYLIDMQIEESHDAPLINVLRELQSKVKTMSIVHEQLYKSNNLSQIDFAEYLRNLLSNLSAMFPSNRMIDLKYNTTEHLLNIETVLPCGMIINELITNSIKYAFPDSFSRGTDWYPTISVQFEKDKNNFGLIVEDNGIGLPHDINWKEADSLGLKLVNIWATYQLGGSIEVKSNSGTRFEITFTKGFEPSN